MSNKSVDQESALLSKNAEQRAGDSRYEAKSRSVHVKPILAQGASGHVEEQHVGNPYDIQDKPINAPDLFGDFSAGWTIGGYSTYWRARISALESYMVFLNDLGLIRISVPGPCVS